MKSSIRKYHLELLDCGRIWQSVLKYTDKFQHHTDVATVIGVLLLILFFVQYGFQLSPIWLLSLQKMDAYKQITGFVLMGYVYNQWHLAIIHLNKHQPSHAQRSRHRIYGALAPLFYYIHSVEFGYAYQSLLTCAFLGNCVIGSIHPKIMHIRSTLYYTCWILSHIGLAITVLLLMFFHLYVTYTY